MNFLSNLKIFIIFINLISVAYMVFYMHSIALCLSCLFIKLRKNLARIVHFLIYCTYETNEHRKHTFICFGNSVRSGIFLLTSYYHLVTSV